jgi:Fe-S oxidoreductase
MKERIGKNVLLVEPDFPYASKSKNRASATYKNFTPIGLLKIGAYKKENGHNVKLVRGNHINFPADFIPDEIWITSLFTYWSSYMWNSVEYYRKTFPSSKIFVGGIYVTLHYKEAYFGKLIRKYNVEFPIVGADSIFENYSPDYSLMGTEIKHHITHASRGCFRKCKFCGVWKIEPKKQYKEIPELIKEIQTVGKNQVIFFDNNFLDHPNIENLLETLAKLRVNKRPVTYECQSGFDGRIMLNNPALPKMLKEARFKNIKIAWDGPIEEKTKIKKQLLLLEEAGFIIKDVSVFMIYNYDLPYEKMIKKLVACQEWKVQINDCRYRPLNSRNDQYKSHMYKNGQTSDDYYIHEEAGWTDRKIRDFRKSVREHNIGIRYANDGTKYNKKMEKWSSIHALFKYFNLGERTPKMEEIEQDVVWNLRIKKLTTLRSKNKKKIDFKILSWDEIMLYQ